MNVEIRDEWTSALRSGNYKQGKEKLHYKDEYCCLGVLCDLAAQKGICEEKTSKDEKGSVVFDEFDSVLPDSVVEWAGVADCNPNVKSVEGDYALAYYNDKMGYNFEQIANLIEKNL